MQNQVQQMGCILQVETIAKLDIFGRKDYALKKMVEENLSAYH